MSYQPIYRYALLPDQAYSAYSRPRRDHEDGSYEIHPIKSGNPSYIPADFEVWPIYYNAIMKVLFEHPTSTPPPSQRPRKPRKSSKAWKIATSPRLPPHPVGRNLRHSGVGFQPAQTKPSKSSLLDTTTATT